MPSQPGPCCFEFPTLKLRGGSVLRSISQSGPEPRRPPMPRSPVHRRRSRPRGAPLWTWTGPSRTTLKDGRRSLLVLRRKRQHSLGCAGEAAPHGRKCGEGDIIPQGDLCGAQQNDADASPGLSKPAESPSRPALLLGTGRAAFPLPGSARRDGGGGGWGWAKGVSLRARADRHCYIRDIPVEASVHPNSP